MHLLVHLYYNYICKSARAWNHWESCNCFLADQLDHTILCSQNLIRIQKWPLLGPPPLHERWEEGLVCQTRPTLALCRQMLRLWFVEAAVVSVFVKKTVLPLHGVVSSLYPLSIREDKQRQLFLHWDNSRPHTKCSSWYKSVRYSLGVGSVCD